MSSETFSESDSMYRSHLFTVQIWREHLSCDESEWRGKVEYVPGREVRYFREWSMLIDFLLEILSQQDLQAESGGKSLQGEEE
jgi:hypothetical protein